MFGNCAFLLTVLACAPPEPKGLKYVFRPDVDRRVEICRGDFLLQGKLDESGDFVQLAKYERNVDLTKYQLAIRLNDVKQPTKVYEFRSGALIPGVMQTDGRFVPTVGSKVIAFKDYEYTPGGTKIWNLPGTFVTEEEYKKNPPKDIEKK